MRSTFRRGFNILELLVGFMVLTYTFAAVLYLFPVSNRALNQGRARLLANHLCHRQLEQATAMVQTGGFAQLATSQPPYQVQRITSTVNDTTNTLTLTYRYEVTDVSTGLKNVESIVEWWDGLQTRSTSLQTMVTQP